MTANVPWTDAERQQLRQLHNNGMSQAQIGKMLGRTEYSVSRQLRNLGLKRERITKPQSPWTHPRGPVGHPKAPKVTLPPLPSLRGVLRDEDWCSTDPDPSLRVDSE